MQIEQLLIRHASQNDISNIMELIQLKAEFDGGVEFIEATPKKIENTLFGDNPLAFVLLAEINKEQIGFATYHWIYSTFLAKPGIWLDDLYVKGEHRSNGIGEMLIKQLYQIAQSKGCGRIDWTVAATNAPAIKFYERMGARIQQDVRLCRLNVVL